MTEVAAGSTHLHTDRLAAIEALRARGASRFDPVGFRFIEALARRTASHRDALARVLERRLAAAIDDFSQRFDRAERSSLASLTQAQSQFPEVAEALQQSHATADFKGLQRLLARRAGQGGTSVLAELLAHIEQHSPHGSGSGQRRGELKAMAYFRSTWTRLNTERELSRSLAKSPANAGPLNSEFLLLQALTSMRDISPDYFRQFMTYADTLLWLEQAESALNPPRKNAARGGGDKKRKADKAQSSG